MFTRQILSYRNHPSMYYMNVNMDEAKIILSITWKYENLYL